MTLVVILKGKFVGVKSYFTGLKAQELQNLYPQGRFCFFLGVPYVLHW